MRIPEVEVPSLLIYVSILISGTSFVLAGDIPQKELTIRSIDANSKSNSEQPARVNLTSIALNVLPIDSKDSLEDKLSNGGVVNAKETSLTGSGSGSDINSSSSSSSSSSSNSVSGLNGNIGSIGSGGSGSGGGIVTSSDVIESQTSKNIQAAGKLTTTPSPKLRKEKSDPYECPNTSEFSFFPHYCSRHANCLTIGKEYRCCRQFNSKRCVKGVPKPLKEQRHEPILGLIPRKCPKEPLAELFWELKTCNTDHDCWPRICCPDGLNKYCRTSRPELDSLPVGKQLAYPIDMLSSYLQCTPAPPTAYDLHPKPCNNTLDCFPNVCCQEAGKKYCRPPKRSLLAFLTTFAQRFNTGPIRQWTDNIVFNR